MSHVAEIELEISDLSTLEEAVKRLGGVLVRNQKHYAWYGHHTGDYPLPEGFTQQDLGKCDHAIRFPDCKYEVGIVKRHGKWNLLWDSWCDGGLDTKLGGTAGLLKQAYGITAAKLAAMKKGYRVTEKRTETGVRLIMGVR